MSERGGRLIRIPSERGQLLLVEGGGKTGRGRRSDGGGNLVAMSALTPHQLFPEAAADVVQLPDAVQPHTVRAYLQAAGVVDGPVIVYLTGRLMVDRRRRELHLGLRDSTPNSVRYDGLPWSWVVELLGARPAENTLVICDLTAGRESWDVARERAHELCQGIPLWGVVNPPDVKGPPSPFTRALVSALTQGFAELPDPVPAEEIHPLLAERAQLAPETVEFAPSSGSLALANCSPESRPPSLRTAVRRLKAVTPRGGPAGTGASALSTVPPNGMSPAQRAGLRGSGVVGGGALPDPRDEPQAHLPQAHPAQAHLPEDPGMGRRALGLVRAALAHSPDDEPEVPGTSRRDVARANANARTSNGKPLRSPGPAPSAAKAEAAFGASTGAGPGSGSDSGAGPGPGTGSRTDPGSSRAPLPTPGRRFTPHPAATRQLRRPTKAAMLAQEPEFPGPTGNPQHNGGGREPSSPSR
ncbi:hypothetical protein, partial [Streptomyces sp. SID3343]|uniref:hypothetical protein n=1 Tax=Streptomyces sp. SID3343 TaxID=2690260 RepID=UPI0013689ED7